MAGVAEAFRRSYAAIGWPESRARGYAMTHDYFSHNIPVPFTFAGRPAQDTARAIDFFLSAFTDDLVVLERGRQLLLRRHAV